MKYILALLALAASAAMAQPGPPGPYGPGRDGPRWDPRERMHPLSCEEWRRDARRHPCVRIPPRCRYR
jgi:hypothetical protein